MKSVYSPALAPKPYGTRLGACRYHMYPQTRLLRVGAEPMLLAAATSPDVRYPEAGVDLFVESRQGATFPEHEVHAAGVPDGKSQKLQEKGLSSAKSRIWDLNLDDDLEADLEADLADDLADDLEVDLVDDLEADLDADVDPVDADLDEQISQRRASSQLASSSAPASAHAGRAGEPARLAHVKQKQAKPNKASEQPLAEPRGKARPSNSPRGEARPTQGRAHPLGEPSGQTSPSIPPRGAKVNARLLTTIICACRTLNELEGVLDAHSKQFNHLHVACMIGRIPKVSLPSPGSPSGGILATMLHFLDSAFLKHLETYTAREVSNVVWAWAKLAHVPGPEVWGATLRAISRCTYMEENSAADGSGSPGGSERFGNTGGSVRGSTGDSRSGRLSISGHDSSSGIRSIEPGGGSPGGPGEEEHGHPTDSHGASDMHPDHGHSSFKHGAPRPASFIHEEHGLSSSKHENQERSSWKLYHHTSSKRHYPLLYSATPQAIVSLAWGLATMNCNDEAVWDALSHATRHKLTTFIARDVAQVAWSFATMGRHDVILFADLAEWSVEHMEDMIPQDLSNILWAFATLGVRQSTLFNAAVPAITTTLSGFTAQNLAMTAWAFARMGCLTPDLAASLCSTSLVNLQSFNTQELTILLWGLARARHKNERLLIQLAQPLTERLSKGIFNAQDVTCTLWAYAVLDHYDEQLFSSLSALLVTHLTKFCTSPTAVAATMWALSSARHYDEELYSAAARFLTTQCASLAAPAKTLPSRTDLNLKQAGMVLYALAHMQHGVGSQETASACTAVSAAVTWSLQNAKQDGMPGFTHLTKCMWAFATLGHQDLQFYSLALRHLSRVVEQVGICLSQYPSQNGGRGRRRVASGGVLPDDLVQDPGGTERYSVAGTGALVPHQGEGQGQGQEMGGHQGRGMDPLSGVIEYRDSPWLAESMQLLQSVLWLHDLCPKTKQVKAMEAKTADLMFSIDMTVAWKGLDIGVEVNGPSHFSATTPYRHLGSKVLRDRLVTSRGYSVLNVPFYEWQAMCDSTELADEYLSTRLDELAGQRREGRASKGGGDGPGKREHRKGGKGGVEGSR
eukprot:gene25919-11595_t